MVPSAARLASFGGSRRMLTLFIFPDPTSAVHIAAAEPVCAHVPALAARAHDFPHTKKKREQPL